MIYYFSGTGNSQWVAEQLARRTNDTALFIPQVMNNLQKDIVAGPDDVVGVVFPIYAWAAPEIVMEFLHHVHVDEKTYTFAVCTCGSEAGRAFDQFKTVFPLKSAYSVSMPDNCISLFDTDRPELMREKLNVATQRMPLIAMNISSRSNTFEIEEGSAAAFKTSVVSPLFTLAFMNPHHFSVDKSCTGCGLCEKNCPFGTIKLVQGKPVWNGRCQQCMSCIMRCPVQAIQCGSATRKRKRYFNPNAGKTPAVFQQNAERQQMPQQQSSVLTQHPSQQETSAFQQQAPQQQGVQHPLASHSSPLQQQFMQQLSETEQPRQETQQRGGQQPSLFEQQTVHAANASSSATGSVEFIAQKDIQVLAKPDLMSRQLISPLNSKHARVTITEVHMQLGACQERHVHVSSEQIWYALRGTAALLLANNEERPFAAGDVVRFGENTVHGVKNTGTDEFVYLSVTTPPQDFTPAYR
jgi:quercetin dioxygenase-like cupin family protein/ferredoxin